MQATFQIRQGIVALLAIIAIAPAAAAAAQAESYEECSGCDQYAPVLPLPSGAERSDDPVAREFYAALTQIATDAERDGIAQAPLPKRESQALRALERKSTPVADTTKNRESWLKAVGGAATDDSRTTILIPLILALAAIASGVTIARRRRIRPF